MSGGLRSLRGSGVWTKTPAGSGHVGTDRPGRRPGVNFRCRRFSALIRGFACRGATSLRQFAVAARTGAAGAWHRIPGLSIEVLGSLTTFSDGADQPQSNTGECKRAWLGSPGKTISLEVEIIEGG